jgi:DNA-binding response OmpR family regulator
LVDILAEPIMATRILIVDDHPDLRDLMSRMLSAKGFMVDVVTQGADALPTALAHPPDVIFLDVMMPDMDGLSVLNQLKADPVAAVIPVVMMTAQIRERVRYQALTGGAARFLGKPIPLGEMLSTIKAVLAEAQSDGARA